MHVVRDRDMAAYTRHVWQSFQLSDVERGGMLPERGTEASNVFHESLYSSLEMEGGLWECAACGRLLFRRPGEQELRSFLPEPGGRTEQAAAADGGA